MFLLVPAYPGCPGSKAVKRSLLHINIFDYIFGFLLLYSVVYFVVKVAEHVVHF